ncbi:MAG TPA: ATPase, T2SS/T4P/T4SS family [Solirubrobacteraceae bacterium]|nr:ATPase, T2SS/T4P/T4SS family [Solirubrobacteraceae bacterium]
MNEGRIAYERQSRLRAVPADGAPVEGALALEDKPWNGVIAPTRRGSSNRFLTDVIVELGLCTRERVDEAIAAAKRAGTTPEQILVAAAAITPDGLARAVAERYGLDFIDLSIFSVDMTAANLVNITAAKRYEALPVGFVDQRTLLVAMAEPANVVAIDDISIMTGYEVRPAVATHEDIHSVISRLSRFGDVVQPAAGDDDDAVEVVDLRESADDAPIVRLVHQLVGQAVEAGASDLHLAPDGQDLRVRLRIDGVLNELTTIPRRMTAGVVSRIKIMAELDISERRIPQDGRVGLTVDGHHVDLRVVTLPTVHGEGVVMRILDKDSVVMDLQTLGMAPDEHNRFERAFKQAYGCVLVTGPTGSGKSTSLYAALTTLNTKEKNVITIEDPVEYELSGVTQIQVNPKSGLTFATGLRSMVRADPDVIMVGEIRDRETAHIAIESALTGHLVLSTLHTNDAPTALTRLVEMGIEPFLVASAIDCVVAQRLVRTLCAHCKRRIILPAETLREYGYHAAFDIEAYEPVGCKHCGQSGYKGRTGIYEVMSVTSEVRSLTIERRSTDEIGEMASSQGMRRLKDDGLEKVKQGRTSIAEVARVCGSGLAG